jgi:acyl-CoA synthetase (AMP-forming)/AMP-acid ligase II
MPVSSRVLAHAKAQPQSTAFVMGDAEASYARLAERATRVAAAISQLARRQRPFALNERWGGRLVGIAVGNHPTFAELFVGATAGDNACAVIDPKWSRAQYAEILPRLQPDLLVVAEADDSAREVAEALGIPVLATDDRSCDYESWLQTGGPGEPDQWLKAGKGESTFLVGFTSGTTSLPKAFHRDRESWRASLETGRAIFMTDPVGATFAPGPLAHGLALYALAETLDAGGTFVGMPAFKSDKAAATVAAVKPDRLVLVPTMLVGLSAEVEADPDIGESVRVVICAGDKLDAGLRGRGTRAFPNAEVIEYYGASELGHVSVWRERDGVDAESVGRPHPAVAVEIRDEAGRPVESGTPGTVFVRSPWICDGYLWASDDKGLRREGAWATVGDKGYLDADGALHLVGRSGGMIVTGGYNVYPVGVEQALRGLPGVEEAVVLGLPDDYLGQRLVAVIGGSGAGDLTCERVRALCLESLPRYKVPRALWAATRWPTTSSGKIARKTLEDWIRDGDPRLRPLPQS